WSLKTRDGRGIQHKTSGCGPRLPRPQASYQGKRSPTRPSSFSEEAPSVRFGPLAKSAFKDREHDVTVTKEDAAECTGGCQCGAGGYRLLRPRAHACICQCRMCQRASGQPFMAFASVRREDLRWTRGRPSTFVSSNIAERNFCSACGTPLTWHRAESGSI